MQYIKTAAATPRVSIGAPEKNAAAILELALAHTDCAVIVFPELCITGYTCADLFAQRWLLDAALRETMKLARALEAGGFAGMAVVVRDGFASVQLSGFIAVKAAGVSTTGWVKLSADGSGGMKTDDSAGTPYLVVQTDADAQTAVILL